MFVFQSKAWELHASLEYFMKCQWPMLQLENTLRLSLLF